MAPTHPPDPAALLERAVAELAAAADLTQLDEASRRYLGKKGEFKLLLGSLGQLPPERRKTFGQEVNTAATQYEEALAARKADLAAEELRQRLADPGFDPTLPGRAATAGTLHPITLVEQRIDEVFRAMGFYVLDYPEADSDFYNFEALNIPATHPARDMQDTFWLDDGNLLRTHTSGGQVRTMKAFTPPFRAIFPGRVFRYESTDASHEHTFHQVEGLYVDRKVSVAHLVASLKTLLSEVLEADVTVRLRPGYFPFVEPGFELDIRCLVCNGAGCAVCKHSSWVELVPCGLVHPAVLRAGGLDPDQWQGWAFGLGLSRIVMMKYRIEDIRHLLSGDVRVLRQFRATGLE